MCTTTHNNAAARRSPTVEHSFLFDISVSVFHETPVTTQSPSKPSQLLELPNELLLEIIDHIHTPQEVSALVLTCRQMHWLANPILYTEKARQKPQTRHRRGRAVEGEWEMPITYMPLMQAVEQGRPEFLRWAIAYSKPNKPLMSSFQMSLALRTALKRASFPVALALLQAGAPVVSGVPPPAMRCLEEKETRPWSDEEHSMRLDADLNASLNTAASAMFGDAEVFRVHFKNEREFWRWKKRVMLTIIFARGLEAIRAPYEALDLSLTYYRRELNVAMGAISQENEPHGVEMMKMLHTAGADPSWKPLESEDDDPTALSWVGTDLTHPLAAWNFNIFKDLVDFFVDRCGFEIHPDIILDGRPLYKHIEYQLRQAAKLEEDADGVESEHLFTNNLACRKAKYLDELCGRWWESQPEDARSVKPLGIVERFLEEGKVQLHQVGDDDREFPIATTEVSEQEELAEADEIDDLSATAARTQLEWCLRMITQARYFEFYDLKADLEMLKSEIVEAWQRKFITLETFCRQIDQLPKEAKLHDQTFWVRDRWVLSGTGKNRPWARLLATIGYELSDSERKFLFDYFSYKTRSMRRNEKELDPVLFIQPRWLGDSDDEDSESGTDDEDSEWEDDDGDSDDEGSEWEDDDGGSDDEGSEWEDDDGGSDSDSN